MAALSRCSGLFVGKRWTRKLLLAAFATLGSTSPILAQQPAPKPAQSDYEKRVVAFIHGTTGVTRQELGEFLIARGGMEKVELLLNKKVLEIEAQKRGISVTTIEVANGLNEDLRSLGTPITLEQFEQQILMPRYGKTLYEWKEDVVRPRLLISKMCRDRVKITDDDLKRAFDNKYGEKREAHIIVWPKGIKDIPELSAEVKQIAATKPEEFDKLAAKQPNKELAEAKGRIKPIGRHIDGEDPAVEKALFELKIGEAKWVETDKLSTCIRCFAITPPDPAVTLETKRAELEREVFEKKLNAEIALFFAELKKAANPALTEHVPLPPANTLPPDAPKPVRVPSADPRVLAVCYGTVAITREDLGEFLIARGGYDKLDLLVNKKIIEMEAARSGVVVTPEEVEATITADLKVLGITKDDFIKVMLPKLGKSMKEYIEDSIRPRLILGKMCRPGVKVNEDDLNRAFENRYGEKRRPKVIIWDKAEQRQALKDWNEARKGDAEFDRMAKNQRDVNLAAAAGATAPMGKFTDDESQGVEKILFSLQVGEVSQLFETPAGIMCVKCVEIIPPKTDVTLAQVRADLEKEVFEKKLAKAVPMHFTELRKTANPNILLKGPPTARENLKEIEQTLQQAGFTVPPSATPMKK